MWRLCMSYMIILVCVLRVCSYRQFKQPARKPHTAVNGAHASAAAAPCMHSHSHSPGIPAWHGKSTRSSETTHVELRWRGVGHCVFFTEGAGEVELEMHRKAGAGIPPRPTTARCTVHKPHQTGWYRMWLKNQLYTAILAICCFVNKSPHPNSMSNCACPEVQ